MEFLRTLEGIRGCVANCKGGDLDNAIVIYEKQMTQENFDKLADEIGRAHV